MPMLTLKYKTNTIAEFTLEEKKAVTIGRRSSNDIVIENLAVSGHHARIDSMGDGFILTDLQSKNGSFVNEKLVSAHWLKPGDVISIGKHNLEFSYGPDEVHPDDSTANLDQTMVMDTGRYRAMMDKSGAIKETVLAEPGPRKNAIGVLSFLSGGKGEIKLLKKMNRIGKGATSDIRIQGFWLGKTVATLSKRPGGFYLSYVGGWVKPKVNSQKISQSIQLKDFDIIEIGATKMQFFIKT